MGNNFSVTSIFTIFVCIIKNMIEGIKKQLQQLFQKLYNEHCLIEEIPASGSSRKYFRLKSSNNTVIGAYNEDFKENTAFVNFSRHFYNCGLRVPRVLMCDLSNHIYLLNDLGDETLFSFLEKNRKPGFSEEIVALYQEVIRQLLRFQIDAARDFDYSACYPRHIFDKQSMMWDLNYFKYYFLKLAGVSYDEQKLEDDFNLFSDFLCSCQSDYFMYRDFQSRNIMIHDKELYFIDYQGGRKGALQYDLASLLYDAKADIPESVRTSLLEFYIENLQQKQKTDVEDFKKYYFGFVLIRIMQAMGAYGYRGYYEKKQHFLKSIPYAINNLKNLIDRHLFPENFKTLHEVITRIIESGRFSDLTASNSEKQLLKVTVQSFSYKKGIPADHSGNGGGFVFDCRGLPNPGRFDEYKSLNGKDQSVAAFLEQYAETTRFFQDTSSLVSQSVENYLKRGFSHLMVLYGCTGGQHRSVYFAEKLCRYLRLRFDINVELIHNEQP